MPPFLSGNLKESNIRILESCETKATGKPQQNVQVPNQEHLIYNPKRFAQYMYILAVHLTINDEMCCIFKTWQPEQLSHMAGISFVDWDQSDDCGHWTHLKFYSQVKVTSGVVHAVFKEIK